MKKWGMALEGAADPDVPAPRPSKKKRQFVMASGSPLNIFLSPAWCIEPAMDVSYPLMPSGQIGQLCSSDGFIIQPVMDTKCFYNPVLMLHFSLCQWCLVDNNDFAITIVPSMITIIELYLRNNPQTNTNHA